MVRESNANPISEYVEGLVVRANPNGFMLRGRDGWLNVSKYAEPQPRIPGEGAQVRVGLDRSGYVRTVEVTGGEEVQGGAEATFSTASTGGDRDLRVTRLACLNTATAILSSGSRTVEVDDVLDLAARLESWVTR